MNALDLFSGIGGISIALSEYCRTKYYCEIEPYCQAVLLSRMASGDLDNALIWDDITTLNAGELGAVDIIVGGFP
jgi:site-specific DNA-cytosine methylase